MHALVPLLPHPVLARMRQVEGTPQQLPPHFTQGSNAIYQLIIKLLSLPSVKIQEQIAAYARIGAPPPAPGFGADAASRRDTAAAVPTLHPREQRT